MPPTTEEVRISTNRSQNHLLQHNLSWCTLWCSSL